jgi:transposase
MPRGTRFSPEFRDRAVRLLAEQRDNYPSEWAAICSLAEKCGAAPETFRKWVRRAEVDAGTKPGVTTDQQTRLQQLERENRELRRANEILKAASVFFARELDPHLPPS